jgi:hypothetical protein
MGVKWAQEKLDAIERFINNILPTTVIEYPETDNTVSESREHTKGSRPSTREKHENANARRETDRGGEKGENKPPRKRPEGWRGPWPPKVQAEGASSDNMDNIENNFEINNEPTGDEL